MPPFLAFSYQPSAKLLFSDFTQHSKTP